jgi:hypothetical protein
VYHETLDAFARFEQLERSRFLHKQSGYFRSNPVITSCVST